MGRRMLVPHPGEQAGSDLVDGGETAGVLNIICSSAETENPLAVVCSLERSAAFRIAPGAASGRSLPIPVPARTTT
jgi:hypothetical protein